jgi:hypothetical protein
LELRHRAQLTIAIKSFFNLQTEETRPVNTSACVESSAKRMISRVNHFNNIIDINNKRNETKDRALRNTSLNI